MPNLLADVFPPDYAGNNPALADLFTLLNSILAWDIVKGGLVFMLAVSAALYAVGKIQRAFGR
jgi:hypothetical protein